MKKIVIFIAVLIPVLTFAQKQKAEDVFNMFYENSYYSYFEISSDLLKDIISMNNIDKNKKDQLSKIKIIRMIELDTARVNKRKKEYEENVKVWKATESHYQVRDFNKYSRFFITFTKNLNNKPYKTLVLYKKMGNSKMLLKREIESSTIEYLLVTDYVAIQIIGDFDLKTISEIQNIVNQLSDITF